jgi:argininosuccinate lyase
MTLWHGRFDAPMDEVLLELSESYPFDQVLWRHDIEGSRAHVGGLERAGLLSREDADAIRAALTAVAVEFEAGTFVRADSDEDIHMAIERRATELVGAAGARLHTARSRNDQVATTLRLFTRDALGSVARDVLALARALDELGERESDVALPGYTHLQRAQPVLLSHHLRAHAWALTRDLERLLDARGRCDVSPLGAGALAGTSLGIDPAATAVDLRFRSAFANSLDAVSDRDFVAESLFVLALIGVHSSRMGEELVLWTSSEFAFATLPDELTTGSSMLPQKKNADVAELARGKAGRLIGNLTGLLVVLKGLPLSYNRDLQEDKEPLFDSLRQTTLVLRALRACYERLAVDRAAMARAVSDPMLAAVDLAEKLVEDGVPFREAHERVGRLVGEAVRGGVPLEDVLSHDEQLAHEAGTLATGAALAARRSPGGAGPVPAAAQRDRLRAELERLAARI